MCATGSTTVGNSISDVRHMALRSRTAHHTMATMVAVPMAALQPYMVSLTLTPMAKTTASQMSSDHALRPMRAAAHARHAKSIAHAPSAALHVCDAASICQAAVVVGGESPIHSKAIGATARFPGATRSANPTTAHANTTKASACTGMTHPHANVVASQEALTMISSGRKLAECIHASHTRSHTGRAHDGSRRNLMSSLAATIPAHAGHSVMKAPNNTAAIQSTTTAREFRTSNLSDGAAAISRSV